MTKCTAAGAIDYRSRASRLLASGQSQLEFNSAPTCPSTGDFQGCALEVCEFDITTNRCWDPGLYH
jgi:hypothetical protein